MDGAPLRYGFFVDGRSTFGKRAIGFFVDGRWMEPRYATGFWVDGRSGYNTENLTTKVSVMKELIQQDLEKLDREQLKQVFEFIAFLKFRARLVAIPAIDETNLAALYSEFAEEDRQLAELGISEYAELLKHEDLA